MMGTKKRRPSGTQVPTNCRRQSSQPPHIYTLVTSRCQEYVANRPADLPASSVDPNDPAWSRGSMRSLKARTVEDPLWAQVEEAPSSGVQVHRSCSSRLQLTTGKNTSRERGGTTTPCPPIDAGPSAMTRATLEQALGRGPVHEIPTPNSRSRPGSKASSESAWSSVRKQPWTSPTTKSRPASLILTLRVRMDGATPVDCRPVGRNARTHWLSTVPDGPGGGGPSPPRSALAASNTARVWLESGTRCTILGLSLAAGRIQSCGSWTVRTRLPGRPAHDRNMRMASWLQSLLR